jgi:hypothetical protein
MVLLFYFGEIDEESAYFRFSILAREYVYRSIATGDA